MNTLLLRSAQENDTKDKYQESFRETDVDCVSVSPIGFEFINLETLYAHISHPEDHSGLIFSSPRTVQSVALCLKKHDENNEWDARLRDEWNKLPAFSVGTSTGGEVRKLGLHPVGEDSGNAENLCRIILEAVKSGSKPLLYPCGTMRREVIPKTLQKEELPVTYRVVSSAYMITFPSFRTRTTSSMNIKKRRGPRSEPWGTPMERERSFDIVCLIETCCFLFVR
ncbi:uroporphyrinogen-III synthase-like isoform X2 [Lytechinus pictus]|uniref:uroporphyrinogen-III synthase-like isoform X2 n=1 Tax=Lytechinus pictus TaxID=7653 RepID=UPI0030B9FCBE